MLPGDLTSLDAARLAGIRDELAEALDATAREKAHLRDGRLAAGRALRRSGTLLIWDAVVLALGLAGTGLTGGLSLVVSAGGLLRLTVDIHGVSEQARARHAIVLRARVVLDREREIRAAIEAVERELERRARSQP